MLEVDALCIAPPHGSPLVDDLSFKVAAGEVLALMGPSGSGKSSVLSWLTGTLAPGMRARGRVSLGGQAIERLPVERRQLGLMLQADYLFPHMSVGENLLFGLRGGTRAERAARVEASLEEAGLDGMAPRDPATLSGGQRARVSLLRTLLSEPRALLLDEPFSGLDATLRQQIREFTWRSAAALPVLLVTHDLGDVPDGARIIEIGPDRLRQTTDVPQTGAVSRPLAGES